MSASEYLSTSALARELDVPSNELFSKLSGMGWIDRKGDKWVLTDLGRSKGGQTRTNPKFGEFIVWPEDVDLTNASSKGRYLNATAIGKHFDLSSRRLNLILAELGWIEKSVAGWTITKVGRSLGGRQLEHDSGSTYVNWPPQILENKRLLDVVAPEEEKEAPFEPVPIQAPTNGSNGSTNFREKFEAKLRTQDGHMVRSRAEVIIDNWLYQYGVVHAYERRLPIEEECYCDFYIPNGPGRPRGVYIEFWGLEEDPKYLERKKRKLEIYRQNELHLIELVGADVDNIDDVLPRKLLQFQIKVG